MEEIALFVHENVDFCFQSGHNLFKKLDYDTHRKAARSRKALPFFSKNLFSISLLSKPPGKNAPLMFSGAFFVCPRFKFQFIGLMDAAQAALPSPGEKVDRRQAGRKWNAGGRAGQCAKYRLFEIYTTKKA